MIGDKTMPTLPRPRYAKAARTRHVPGRMNKSERAYADGLDVRLAAGDILSWRFEPIKIRLADRTFWEPDFLVVAEDGVLELHEVKGHMEDDAAVKLKVAAEFFPWFRVYVVWVTRSGGQHSFEPELVR